jgi:hypothetical protein
MMLRFIFLTVSIYMLSFNANADIEVSFKDGAPKDKFTLENTSTCDLNDIVMTIDLSGSIGGLIFDTTESGEGVEVFQPFEVTKGQISLNATQINDGDKQLTLTIKTLKANDVAGFTIDVDDTLTRSELGNIRVTDTEIKGGSVSVNIKGHEVNTPFDFNGKAVIVMSECTS